MTRRPIVVLLAGAALRELLPLLRRLADWADPAGTAPDAWGPRATTPLTVPAAWCEIEGER